MNVDNTDSHCVCCGKFCDFTVIACPICGTVYPTKSKKCSSCEKTIPFFEFKCKECGELNPSPGNCFNCNDQYGPYALRCRNCGRLTHKGLQRFYKSFLNQRRIRWRYFSLEGLGLIIAITSIIFFNGWPLRLSIGIPSILLVAYIQSSFSGPFLRMEKEIRSYGIDPWDNLN